MGDSISTDSPELNHRIRSFAGYFAFIVMLMGIVVLIGWFIGSTPLKSVVPGMISMKINTALGLILLSIALVGLDRRGRRWQWIFHICLTVVALLAILTLGEYVLGLNFHIDNLLVYDRASVRFPGRNAPATNLAFLGLVIAFALQHWRTYPTLAQLMLLIVAAAPLATWGGYLYQAPAMYQNAPYPVIALNTSIALMLLCVGGLFAGSGWGLMRIVMSDSLAGSLARKLLPASGMLPLLTGLLVLIGQRAGLYTPMFGSAMLVACCGIFFALAVSWTVTALWNTEGEREILRKNERQALAHAEKANRMKDEFLAVVSHELRTPLNAILGWSQMLRVNADPADLSQGLESIERNAKAQVQIIEDLLDMGRIISGKVKLDIVVMSLADVIGSSVDTMEPAASAKGVLLHRQLDPTTGKIRGDADRLQQVIWNLVSNAIKFTPKGGSVRVTLEEIEGHAQVCVIDTGEGIKLDFIPFIFERFRQADASTTRRFGGLGLGLSIVKNLIELHGGTVSVSSAGQGRGSTFCIQLPLVTETSEPGRLGQSQMKSDPSFGGTSFKANLRGLQILVVDDEADGRSMAKHLLESCDATATVAESVDQAMRLLDDSTAKARKVFDVIISDIGMPIRDGFDLIKSIRQLSTDRGGRTPAVALTAFARSEDRTRAMLAGFDIHLAKPVDPSELCAVIARLAGREK